MEERYLIIADDFTGANDTGVQLRRRGFPTEVLFCGKPMGADRSIVIDTESRTVHPDHAYEIVSHALEDVDYMWPNAATGTMRNSGAKRKYCSRDQGGR